MNGRNNKKWPVFGIVGWKNSGKTTLTEKLIKEFTLRGMVVSVAKHAHHSFDVDHENTDSHKLRQAGARRTAIISQNRWAMIHELREESEPPLEEILQHIGECDLILVEGYKNRPMPKIEVRNADDDAKALSDNDPDILAVACRGKINVRGAPFFDANDIRQIADFIEEKHSEIYL